MGIYNLNFNYNSKKSIFFTKRSKLKVIIIEY